MKRDLLPRKTRFRRSSKGVSTVIGTIFLVLIALTVATNVFLWSFAQNAAYNQAVKERGQMDADLSSERIVAYDTIYSVNIGSVDVSTTIVAEGPLSAQIITIWVTWTNGNNTKYGSEPLNINLTPGDTITLPKTVNVPGALPAGGVCNGWLVTARGNLVPLEEKRMEKIKISDVTLGIGAISMNFTNFKYYNVTENVDDYVLVNYPNGTSGYNVNQRPKQEYPGIAFQVTITNFDLENRSIILSSSSLLWMLFPTTELSIRGAMWYIVNVDDGIIADTFTPIIIAHNSETTLYFASENDVNDVIKPGFTPCLSGFGGTAAVNLALVGQIGGSPYGQNLPFVSIHLTMN